MYPDKDRLEFWGWVILALGSLFTVGYSFLTIINLS